MPVKIYNSLTKKKEELVPLNDEVINMYTCGVTVYDDCHIGHARSLYLFDMIKQYLEYRGFTVNFVRNITDVDDKIIKRALDLKKSSAELSNEFIANYERDLVSLGIVKTDPEPRATQNIPGMIEHIEGLIENGTAYEIEGDVYFSVRKFPSYGKLSGQSIDKMLEAVRIEEDPKKQDPLDFALWKASKPGEPSWESPWGPGRPGWHIECSYMSLKHLKTETLDIHAGGRDLIFPHHENEIAQAEALTGKPFAKYWIHHGLLTINGQKMSKSLGNFVTIQDALKKYSVDEIKMFFLSAHYASDIDFNDKKMADMKKALDRFDILFWKASEIIKNNPDAIVKNADFIKESKERFLGAMDDDFNTAMALGHLFDLVSKTNAFIEDNRQDPHYAGVVYRAVDTIEDLTKGIFGLFSDQKLKALTPEQEELLAQREQARAEKDFNRSDEIRDLLKDQGIIVEDTKDGQVWRWA